MEKTENMKEDYTIFYEVISGSQAYGFANEDSDQDLRAVAFPSYSRFFGLVGFDFAEVKEPDRQIYSLRKFVNLALNANPNILELLFIDSPELVIYSSDWSDELKKIREKFVTKKIFKTYMGYVTSQLHKLKAHRTTMGSKRFEGIQKIGYDVKAAAHVIRLLNQCLDFAQRRTLSFPLKPEIANYCRQIREGQHTLGGILEYAEDLIASLRNEEKSSPLPNSPDFEKINNFVSHMHHSFYYR